MTDVQWLEIIAGFVALFLVFHGFKTGRSFA